MLSETESSVYVNVNQTNLFQCRIVGTFSLPVFVTCSMKNGYHPAVMDISIAHMICLPWRFPLA